MKAIFLLVFLTLFSVGVTGQDAEAIPSPSPTATPFTTAQIAQHKNRVDQAAATTDVGARVRDLEAFVSEAAGSPEVPRARAALAAGRVTLADERLQQGATAEAVALMKQAVTDAPTPMPDRLFTDIFVRIPGRLYFAGERTPALDIAEAIEKKMSQKPDQLLLMSQFYLSIEDGARAERMALAAVAADPSAAAHSAVGIARRLQFDLEGARESFASALELDPASAPAKRGLADMTRAIGKPAEAAAIYRELLDQDENDAAAETGYILSLLDSGKRAEAEAALDRSLETNPSNVVLLAGAAYAYAAQGNGDKAVEFGDLALALEPRYIWSYIAMGRGFMLQNKPLEAERVLLAGRRYGNFPTLEFEIANARVMAGFYREAAEDLRTYFEIRDGLIRTRLGGRVERSALSFEELTINESRASIFAPKNPVNADRSAQLKTLLELSQAIDAGNAAAASEIIDRFVMGSDEMKLHRQIYSAGALLEKRLAPEKVHELARAATGNTDRGLQVPHATMAVMANELYAPRREAALRYDYVAQPDVPKQTLSAILRGRIEELAGAAFLMEGRNAEAAIRFRRAISVVPERSAWSRSAHWRLGSVLQSDGNDKEALAHYLQGYDPSNPEVMKYVVIESLYAKVNGSTDGLERRIGPNPLPPTVGETPATLPAAPAEQPQAPVVVDAPIELPPTVDEVTVDEMKAPPVTDEATPDPPVAKPVAAEVETVKEVEANTEAPPVIDGPAIVPIAQPVKEVKAEVEEEETEEDTPTEEVLTSDEPDPPVEDPAPPLEKALPPTADKRATPKVVVEDRTTLANEKAAAEKKKASLFEPIIIGVPSSRPRRTEADAARCEIKPSQENVSIMRNGGTVGILVGISGPAGTSSASDIRAISRSPNDVEVVIEKNEAAVSSRVLFVIRSVSDETGTFKVVLLAPCGEKEISVRVR